MQYEGDEDEEDNEDVDEEEDEDEDEEHQIGQIENMEIVEDEYDEDSPDAGVDQFFTHLAESERGTHDNTLIKVLWGTIGFNENHILSDSPSSFNKQFINMINQNRNNPQYTQYESFNTMVSIIDNRDLLENTMRKELPTYQDNINKVNNIRKDLNRVFELPGIKNNQTIKK